MTQRSYTIRGTPAAPEALRLGAGISVHNARRLIPGRARDGVSGEEQVAADELVRVELENGFVLWTRADSLVREHGRRSLSRDGHPKEAIPKFEQALARDPNHAWAKYNLGVALQRLGEHEAAIIQYKQAVELNPAILTPEMERYFEHKEHKQQENQINMRESSTPSTPR